MSKYIYNKYYIEIPPENMINPFSIISNNTFDSNYQINPQQFQFDNVNNNTPVNTNNPNINLITTPSISLENNLWRPSEAFQRIYNKFQLNILKEYPDTPCVYCGRLLYKNKATWIPYNSLVTYPIEQVNQIDALALSRCPKWENIQIASLDKAAFMTNPDVVREYERLEIVAASPLPI